MAGADRGGCLPGPALAFILDHTTARAIRRSLELPAQEPAPLAHAPPEALELLAESV